MLPFYFSQCCCRSSVWTSACTNAQSIRPALSIFLCLGKGQGNAILASQTTKAKKGKKQHSITQTSTSPQKKWLELHSSPGLLQCVLSQLFVPPVAVERVGLGFLFLCNCRHVIARLHQLRLWVVHLKCDFCKSFPLLCLTSNILFWPSDILQMYSGECVSVQVGDVRYPRVQSPTCSS